MSEINIMQKIVEQRKKDILERGYNFGFDIPKKRTRKIIPFMQEKGVILEVKRASPSKGNIAPNLNAVETAKQYALNGAKAISCLTEENYFKGLLKDLIDICNSIDDLAILRKDFLIDEKEIEIAYLCGADAVLLISGILTLDKMISMTAKCKELGIKALVEVRSQEDVEKVLEIKKLYEDVIVCGVNSRNLKNFSIDLLVPCMLKNLLGTKVIFESGIETEIAAKKIASLGFTGILLGEFAARNPVRAGEFVKAFLSQEENLYGKKMLELATRIYNKKRDGEQSQQTSREIQPTSRPRMSGKIKFQTLFIKICGLTKKEDVLLADSLGADFVGFIFANGYTRNVCGEKFLEIKSCLDKINAFKVAVITDVNSNEAKIASKFVKEGVLDFIQIHNVSYEDAKDFISDIPYFFAVTDKNCDDKNHNIEVECKKLNSFGEARFLLDCKNTDLEKLDIPSKEHLWIAGGLTCDNVHAIVAKYKPELVDVSSGIEDDKPGIKNADKMKKFFDEVRR